MGQPLTMPFKISINITCCTGIDQVDGNRDLSMICCCCSCCDEDIQEEQCEQTTSQNEQ